MEHLLWWRSELIEKQRRWSSPREIEPNDYLLRLVAGWIAMYLGAEINAPTAKGDGVSE